MCRKSRHRSKSAGDDEPHKPRARRRPTGFDVPPGGVPGAAEHPSTDSHALAVCLPLSLVILDFRPGSLAALMVLLHLWAQAARLCQACRVLRGAACPGRRVPREHPPTFHTPLAGPLLQVRSSWLFSLFYLKDSVYCMHMCAASRWIV